MQPNLLSTIHRQQHIAQPSLKHLSLSCNSNIITSSIAGYVVHHFSKQSPPSSISFHHHQQISPAPPYNLALHQNVQQQQQNFTASTVGATATFHRNQSAASTAIAASAVQQQMRLGNMKLRRGKWTLEEESYANRLIEEFENGTLLDCENGCTLRAFLSRKLHCAPMRISKKFAGKSIGKHVFLSRNPPGRNLNGMNPLNRANHMRNSTVNFENLFYASLLHEVGVPAGSIMRGIPPFVALQVAQGGSSFPNHAGSMSMVANGFSNRHVSSNDGSIHLAPNVFASHPGHVMVSSTLAPNNQSSAFSELNGVSMTNPQKTLQENFLKAMNLPRNCPKGIADSMMSFAQKQQVSANSNINSLDLLRADPKTLNTSQLITRHIDGLQMNPSGVNVPENFQSCNIVPPCGTTPVKEGGNAHQCKSERIPESNNNNESLGNNGKSHMKRSNSIPDILSGFDNCVENDGPPDLPWYSDNMVQTAECAFKFTSSFDELHQCLGKELPSSKSSQNSGKMCFTGPATLALKQENNIMSNNSQISAQNSRSQSIPSTISSDAYATFAVESARAVSKHAAYAHNGDPNILRDAQALIDRNLQQCNSDRQESEGNICMNGMKSSHNRMSCEQPPGKRARIDITSDPEVVDRSDFSKADFMSSRIAIVSGSERSGSETGNEESESAQDSAASGSGSNNASDNLSDNSDTQSDEGQQTPDFHYKSTDYGLNNVDDVDEGHVRPMGRSY